MRVIFLNSCFLFLLCLFSFAPEVHSQCGSTFESPYMNAKSKNSAPKLKTPGCVNLKLTAWIVNMDDGSGSFEVDDIENFMGEVAAHFVDVEIIIDPCVKELNSTLKYESETSTERWFSDNCSSMHLTIYDSAIPNSNGTGNITGAAFRGSDEGWTSIFGDNLPEGYNYTDVARAVHEIGHMLGLAHTFDRNCSGGARECASQYCANMTSDDLADYEIDEGDGLCDTPADQLGGCPRAFSCGSGCISESNGLLDDCGEPYEDPTGFVACQNFMSYTGACGQIFTKGQQLKMHHTIQQNHSGRIGTFGSSCQFETLTGIYTGTIKDQVVEYNDLTLTLDTDLEIENSTVWFRNCHLKFSNEFVTRIAMSNSTVYLVDGSTIGSAENCAGDEGAFQGIEMIRGTNFFSTANGCEITGTLPFLNASDKRGFVFCRDFTINGTLGTAVLSSSPILVYGNDNIINGAISFGQGAIPHFAEYAVVLRDSKVRDSAPGNRTGIDGGTATIYLWNSEVSGFRNAIKSLNSGIVSIDGCYIESTGNNIRGGVDIDNALGVTLNNSRFEGANVKLVNTAQYSITYNEFMEDCGFSCTRVILDNGVDADHEVHHNIIKSDRHGLASVGNSETKFLCNKFDDSSEQNFYWEKVNSLQGFAQDVASGNLFSENTADQVGGNSIGVDYNYFENNPPEVLDMYSNVAGVFPISLDIQEANCGIIGPNWTVQDPDCPVGIACDDPCPDGIDCDEDCPPGIDCTVPCPPGIDCTSPCPPNIDCTVPCLEGPEKCTPHCPDGIDCTKPCPDGIDCTKPCPDGIDCTKPCPDGIDCTKPCPTGVNCFEPCPPNQDCYTPCLVGENGRLICDPVKPEVDPVLEMVELQYQSLNNERTNFEEQLYPGSEELGSMLINQEIHSEGLLSFLHSKPQLRLSPKVLKHIFEESHLYFEKEMVEILRSAPLAMYDSDINNTVFHSGTFKTTSIEELMETYEEFSSSDAVGELWNIDRLDRSIYRLVKFAVQRLLSYGPDTENEVNLWLSRLDDPNASSISAANYAALGKYEKAMNALSYSSKGKLQNFESSQYEMTNFVDYLQELDLDGERLNSLSEISMQKLINYADSDSKTVKSSAQALLEEHYGMSYDLEFGTKFTNDKLQFKVLEKEGLQGMKIVKAYPNPTRTGVIYFQSNGKSELDLSIYNALGERIYKGILIPNQLNTVNLGNESGHFLYNINDKSGNLISEDKIIVIN